MVHHSFPFILALDVNFSSVVHCLIHASFRTCVSFQAPDAERTLHKEPRHATPTEITIYVIYYRWSLAGVLRVSGGDAVRSLLAWDACRK